MLSRGPSPDPDVASGPPTHSPRFSKMLIIISWLGNDEQRYKVDVVVIWFELVMQHRPFSFGEGIRGMRPLRRDIKLMW